MFERYYQELLNFCTRTLRDRDAAADVVQECYARVLSLQRSGHPVPEPRALLYRTARNLQIDQHRRELVRGDGPTAADADALTAELEALTAPAASEPETAAASAQVVDRLLHTIQVLPLRCREAFILHKFDGLSHAEVAVQMGVSRKAVEQLVMRGMQACRHCRDECASTPPCARSRPARSD